MKNYSTNENQLILTAINNIEAESDASMFSVMESMIDAYDKAVSIIVESDETSLGSFDIFQESFIMEASNDGEPKQKLSEQDFRNVDASGKTEKLIVSILKFIPRAIAKLIAFIKSKFTKKTVAVVAKEANDIVKATEVLDITLDTIATLSTEEETSTESMSISLDDTKALPMNETTPSVIDDTKALPMNKTTPSVIDDTKALPMNKTTPSVIDDTKALPMNKTTPSVIIVQPSEDLLKYINDRTAMLEDRTAAKNAIVQKILKDNNGKIRIPDVTLQFKNGKYMNTFEELLNELEASINELINIGNNRSVNYMNFKRINKVMSQLQKLMNQRKGLESYFKGSNPTSADAIKFGLTINAHEIGKYITTLGRCMSKVKDMAYKIEQSSAVVGDSIKSFLQVAKQLNAIVKKLGKYSESLLITKKQIDIMYKSMYDATVWVTEEFDKEAKSKGIKL